MSQDGIRELLRKSKQPLSLKEIAEQSGLNYRTAAMQVQTISKWQDIDVTYMMGRKFVKIRIKKESD